MMKSNEPLSLKVSQGLYEEIISEELESKLYALKDHYAIGKGTIDPEEAHFILSKYIGAVIKRALEYVREDCTKEEDNSILNQISVCNDLIHHLATRCQKDDLFAYKISEQSEILLSLYLKINTNYALGSKQIPIRPTTSISESSLFTGAAIEPNMVGELKKEIMSCDQISILVSFIRWSGLRLIIEELKAFVMQNDNHRVRVITTSYMGATEYKAIEALSDIKNVEIKISYDTDRTRLHAKAYLFLRETGYTTAYIGSSNISGAAITSGLEWNMKVSERDSFHIVKKFGATFESYWNDPEFETVDTSLEEHRSRLLVALKKEKSSSKQKSEWLFDIRPYFYQKEILAHLKAERELFGRYKNLVVAATGVGKTVVSAFDYKNYVNENKGKPNKLLFVAHRKEILDQSIKTFRAILRDHNFGELFVGEFKPSSLDHLFVSIQTFNSQRLYEKTSKDNYDFIIVDEFHHAAADSYQKLLDYYQPKILLGLTATPERMDGKNILEHFDGRIASEMRLSEAIDQQLLCSFQYFGVSDTIDYTTMTWCGNHYDPATLSKVYTGDERRTSMIIESVYRYVNDIDEVKGIGFCVTKEHALYTAQAFKNHGIACEVIISETGDEIRYEAKERLQKGDVKFIFTVDIYNEGVDIPEINTVLFLRPTESLTVFLQQLGRGLRRLEGKECLTVLDFIGQAHKKYSYEEKFKALMGRSRHSLQYTIENSVFKLPKGCFIQLEKLAKDYVLKNIKAMRNNLSHLTSRIQFFTADTAIPLNLRSFLTHYHLRLIELYGASGDRSFTSMKAKAGLLALPPDYNETVVKRFKNLFHLNSRRFLQFAIRTIEDGDYDLHDENERLMLNMLYYSFYTSHPGKEGFGTLREGIEKALAYKAIRLEVLEILQYLFENIDFVDKEVDMRCHCPLDLHCRYTRDQLLAGFGDYNEKSSVNLQAGVKYLKDKKTDVFLITLNKSDKDFSPTTLYDDYAINERLFHWQSQSQTSDESVVGQRYIHHRQEDSQVVLFVREYKKEEGVTSPYIYLGKANYVRHEGSRPISFVWELEEAIPPGLIVQANKSVV